jgi:glutathione S-transferase
MAIRMSGVTVELREVVLRDKPEALRLVSPKATVPVLCLADGRVLDESLDIMRWALNLADPLGWLHADSATTDALIARNDGPFKRDLDRYKYGTRYPDSDVTTHRDAGVAWLSELDARLRDRPEGAGLVVDHLTLADIALAPFVRQFANTDRAMFDALPLPHLQRWLTAILGAPVFTEVMAKVPQWTPGQTPVCFP